MKSRRKAMSVTKTRGVSSQSKGSITCVETAAVYNADRKITFEIGDSWRDSSMDSLGNISELARTFVKNRDKLLDIPRIRTSNAIQRVLADYIIAERTASYEQNKSFIKHLNKYKYIMNQEDKDIDKTVAFLENLSKEL